MRIVSSVFSFERWNCSRFGLIIRWNSLSWSDILAFKGIALRLSYSMITTAGQCPRTRCGIKGSATKLVMTWKIWFTITTSRSIKMVNVLWYEQMLKLAIPQCYYDDASVLILFHCRYKRLIWKSLFIAILSFLSTRLFYEKSVIAVCVLKVVTSIFGLKYSFVR